MNIEIIKLSILTFIAGVFSKIYDDLNDNKIFDSLFFKNNKDYINEFLKGIHYILLIYVSSIHIYPLLLFVLPNIILFITDSKAFDMPYEYSGIIAFFLFSFYLVIDNFSKLKTIFNRNIIFIGVTYMILTYFFDTLLFKNVEFGYKKLAVRGVMTILMTVILSINYYFKLLPDELMFCLWYIIGYCLTSCFFQAYSIWKSNDQPNEPNKDENPNDETNEPNDVTNDETNDVTNEPNVTNDETNDETNEPNDVTNDVTNDEINDETKT